MKYSTIAQRIKAAEERLSVDREPVNITVLSYGPDDPIRDAIPANDYIKTVDYKMV